METYYVHFQVDNSIMGCLDYRFTCFNAQRTHRFSHTIQCCSTLFALHLKCSVLAPVPLRPSFQNTHFALIGQLTHAWASTAYCVSSCLCRVFNLPVSFTCAVNMGMNYANTVFCGKAMCFLTFRVFYMYKNQWRSLKERKEISWSFSWSGRQIIHVQENWMSS